MNEVYNKGKNLEDLDFSAPVKESIDEPIKIRVAGRERIFDTLVFILGAVVLLSIGFYTISVQLQQSFQWLIFVILLVITYCLCKNSIWFFQTVGRIRSSYLIDNKTIKLNGMLQNHEFDLAGLRIGLGKAGSFKPDDLLSFEIEREGAVQTIIAPSFWVNGDLARFRFLLELYYRGVEVKEFNVTDTIKPTPSSDSTKSFGLLQALFLGTAMIMCIGFGLSFNMLIQISSIFIIVAIILALLSNKKWSENKARSFVITEDIFQVFLGVNMECELPREQAVGIIIQTRKGSFGSSQYRMFLKTAYSRLVPLSSWSQGSEMTLYKTAGRLLASDLKIDVINE